MNKVLGVGINDADETVSFKRNGKKVMCPFYARWFYMLRRCYSDEFQKRNPTYIGCSVCSDWLTFSKFRDWMAEQEWEGKQLDKDLIFEGNKVYSPDTCVFVDLLTNSFINERKSLRGNYLIGVSFNSRNKTYQSRCRNPFTKEPEYLGYFKTELAAHLAWRNRKHELACQLAEMQHDPRVSKSLKEKYL